ncbi:hypothetical protein H6P81_015439 [Aristolochia fimbriata]|uniref:Protein pleiotropic regulatory locus 1 n=1 Tax=Aristolochia fimbriata TaxID=158543 RepID=A0AAV7E7F2_ARIFI|nr:hypothetical protein H6P81_015439 [Aristolochia fimbriata]
MPGAMATLSEPMEPKSLQTLSRESLKRSLNLFSPVNDLSAPSDPKSKELRTSYKLHAEYEAILNVPSLPSASNTNASSQGQGGQTSSSQLLALPGGQDSTDLGGDRNAIVVAPSAPPKGLNDTSGPTRSSAGPLVSAPGSSERFQSTSAIMERIPSKWPRPEWHRPWKNYRVISGHLGWVRSIAFDSSNSWFCTGSADRTIKIWDVASGRLKLTLTGHIEQIRGLAVHPKYTYMFSAGDDKQVKCWDLEQNKVIRSYHGHLSGVYCLALHPTLDVLFTGGRDSVCRVWDIRSKSQIFALSGHENTVCSVFTRPTDPQVVTGSHDTTIKFWDLRAGKSMATLTNHKKSVRAMALHPKERAFASASADNIKKFTLPKGEFVHNMLSQQKSIINAMAVNEDGVVATAGDNGSLWFWDWKSGHNFQQAQTIVQPGSLDSEAAIYALSYDLTGTRLVSCEADKTIKMWKEDETATEQTHPLNFRPPKDIRRF